MKEESRIEQGCIFNIQRFSLHDGEGIRSLIFMKGCPLRCLWCSNPESQQGTPEIGLRKAQCIHREGCDLCVKSCPEGAVRASGEAVEIDRDRCTRCGACAEACPTQAIQVIGENRTLEEILETIEKDSAYYWRSGGGVTIGGGEPLFQSDFVLRILEACKERGFDTAVETAGHGPFPDLDKLAAYTDNVYYDVKHMDAEKHKDYTGVTNELILDNLEKLGRHRPDLPIIARTPVVPGFNNTPADILAIERFLRDIPGVRGYELLAYHAFGAPKYEQLGRHYALLDLERPEPKDLEELKEAVRSEARVKIL